MVQVKSIENYWQVVLTDPNFEVTTRLRELIQTQATTFIVVHNLKHSLETDYSSRTSGLNPVPKKFHHLVELILTVMLLIIVFVLLGCLQHSISLTIMLGLKPLAQVFVVDAALTLFIVVSEDLIQILVTRACRQDNTQFLDGSFELVYGDAPSILDIEKLKCLAKEGRFLLSGGTLLLKFLHEVFLETKEIE